MREIVWVGSSLDDLRAFPAAVQRIVGYALFVAQVGGKHSRAKPLKGFFGAGVLEVVADFDGDTYRAIYTVTLSDADYVLHAFQKESAHGIATPRRELDVVRRRFQQAQTLSAERRSDDEGSG